jgi:hypothetical protein
MRRIKEILGELIDALVGPSTTFLYADQEKHALVELEPTLLNRSIKLRVVSKRITFLTVYQRWYIPRRYRTVYEVVGVAQDKQEALDQRLFEKVTYPMLTFRVLKWTQYPHLYAINAYLDRVLTKHEILSVDA